MGSLESLGFALASLCLGIGCAGQQSGETKPSLYVGVIPVSPGLNPDFCSGGFNREPVTFRMDDDNTSHCSNSTGSLGEGSWVAPAASKPPPQVPPCAASTWSTLHTCRVEVEPDDFKPLTSDPEDAANFYAVLMFGDRCPEGSTEVSKRIVNEDKDGNNLIEGAPDAALPNYTESGGLGNATKLYFCFFRAAATVEQTMTAFPDLLIPYAVFHDFDGDQPGWVLEKRWQYSDDENNGNDSTTKTSANGYSPADQGVSGQFQRLVENPQLGSTSNTYFDLARVH